jgi:uncharacterized protein
MLLRRSRLLALLAGPSLLLTGCAGGPPERSMPSLHPEVDGWDVAEVVLTPPGRDAVRVQARVARTAAQRARGLMGVAVLPSGTGMLFEFPTDTDGAFWMKDTLVPLDIGFVAADGTLLAVLTMPPCERDPCPTYDPAVTYRRALEVPAGWFAANGVGPGASVRFGP